MTQRIIVIDDSETVREQLALVLNGAGYEVVEAEDGAQGAAAIRENPDASLAICDVNMPRMNGLDVLQQVGGAIPVLMLTTEGRPDLIERARASSPSRAASSA